MTDTLAQAEADKYAAVWRYDAYRKNAPGEKCVFDAFKALGIKEGDTLIDFGCGTGRPARAFQEAGIHVTAVDFAVNCLDEGVKVPFRQACLWNLPDDMIATYGFCTDVMEHIPPEKVDAVLANIRAATTDGVFFQIATRPDTMGRLIGRTLHLTVKSADWWAHRLRLAWPNVTVKAGVGSMTAVCWP